ncbi:D-2-hydroxyacid dehydrogenase [Isoptericola sp. AK164]|uniref:D-2-hydroxyacid dehydrogenase n=1 Tax=Isoptericola sp. AK164 TaxID=3024246 RepID=UPI0024181B5F|nr:D-2-hydroxyacid dehydrogenase [Isoptericola sp. AK164]
MRRAAERRLVVSQVALDDEAVRRLHGLATDFDVVVERAPSAELLASAEVVAGRIDPELVPAASALRWNHLWTAGADADLSAEMRTAEQVAVTSSAGNGAVPLAEHALMLMLMLDRDAPRLLTAQRKRSWDRFRHPELAGQTVGVVGMGAAGQDLVGKARAFHLRVVGLRNRPEVAVPGVERMYGPDDILAFAAECDYLVVAAPLTPQTQGMIDARVLAAMRPTAALVNVSRGEIIDDDALLAALTEGRLSGAGLDAHTVEPLPADSPWWTAPGVIVTPHNGATTPQTLDRAVAIFLENVERYVDGRPLRNLVDKSSGYALV